MKPFLKITSSLQDSNPAGVVMPPSFMAMQ